MGSGRVHDVPADDDGAGGDVTAEKARKSVIRWKIVMAADSPWEGVVYETRAGRRRESFHTPEEFVRAVMLLTGWHLPK